MAKIRFLFFILIFVLLFSPILIWADNTATGKKIVVYCHHYYLKLYDRKGKVIKKYPVGIGSNGTGKTREGDRKTPLGNYRIIWKASRFAKTDGGHLIEDGKAFCGPDNIFTTDPNVGYSSEKLWTDGYGGSEAVVMCLDYPNETDRAKGYTGGCIEIHATKLGGIGKRSSAGCIRMNPGDARDLYNQVKVGTPVIIKNK
ncbi:MAG: murein L,D-transpeptidase family protein [Vulcanimicrobiota bacterium]